MKYKVVYEIEIDAITPKEAALEVEEILRNGDFRPFLEVTDEQGNVTEIDLEDE